MSEEYDGKLRMDTDPVPSRELREVERRILRARTRALEMEQQPWFVGVRYNNAWNDRANDRVERVYMVASSDGERTYYQMVRDDNLAGGFCYSALYDETAVPVWIRCTCEAGSVHHQPCKHAARVYLRLEAEELEERSVLTRAREAVARISAAVSRKEETVRCTLQDLFDK